jgi:hypothetical protein
MGVADAEVNETGDELHAFTLPSLCILHRVAVFQMRCESLTTKPT